VITSSASTTATQVFPHYADGGEWQTEFLLLNPNSTPVTAEMRFHQDGGGNLSIEGQGAVPGIPNIIIPANGSAFYRTTGFAAANTVSGWVEVLSPRPLNGTALFRRHPDDGKYYEGSIPLTTPANGFIVPFDGSTFNTGSLTVTALALANPNSAAGAQVTCSAYDLNGSLLGTGLQIASLAGFGHTGLQLQASDPEKTAIGNKRGTLVCNSTSPIGVLGLRFFGTAALSSLPVITGN
jgi:hypothetical protein